MENESVSLLQELLANRALMGAIGGAIATAFFAFVAYFWKLHSTASTNKTKLEDHMALSKERDKHLDTKIQHVHEKVVSVDTKVDRMADKIDLVIQAHQATHEILIRHVAHEESHEKVIFNLAEKLNSETEARKIAAGN